MSHILYLHGFHSSPYSEKAMLFKRFIEQNHPQLSVIAPQIDVLPGQAVQQVTDIFKQYGEQIIGLVGSSMGGYLSTYLHNEFDVKAVVVNPAVKPFELLAGYLGEQVHPVTNQPYTLEQGHMSELKAIYQEKLRNPKKVWLLQQEGDEVLDFRQALNHYQDCRVTCEVGGNHSFDGFERHLPAIVEFLQR